MNIIIPDSWLRDYLETKATPKQIAKILSSTAASVERIEKTSGDFIYYLEITTNRVDMMSVLGIAKELVASLPESSIKAILKKNLPDVSSVKTYKKVNYLGVKIADSNLCKRFTAVLFEIEKMTKTPKLMVERLNKIGIRSLNPVIDVTNYLMFELGQPMHVFDYEKIKKQKMILRESKNGEKIITLDGYQRILPDGAIVIEDGNGNLIDLCGIMGAENSCVDENTTKVLLFVQTYNPVKIRKTIQALNFRTEAATRFEKGLDSEMVLPATIAAVSLYKKILKVKKLFPIVDIYGKRAKSPKILLPLEKVNAVIGIKLNPQKITSILSRLGFKVEDKGKNLLVFVPSYRANDILIPEDLIEEIARVYGYHKLPSIVPKTDFLIDFGFKKLEIEKEVKKALLYWGFSETYTYSMISEKEIVNSGFSLDSCLSIANPLTKDYVYMRPSLIPSLLSVISQNQDNSEKIDIFELSRIYLKTKGKLPDEPRILSGLSNNKDFASIKGIVEALFEKLNIKDIKYQHLKKESKVWQEGETAEIKKNEKILGFVGKIKGNLLLKFGVEKIVTGFELNFEEVIKNISPIRVYQPIPLYPPIIEDLAFVFPERVLVGEVVNEIYSINPLINKVEFLDAFKDSRTFRIYYQSKERNLTDKEVKEIREKIIKRLKEKFGLKLKEK